MPKLELTGKLEQINDAVSIPYGEGKSFLKREIILDCTTYDRFTGDPKENHVLFEFSGNKCSLLDKFKVGDRVTISFVLQGFFYESKTDHQKKNITKVIGYDCQAFDMPAKNEEVKAVKAEEVNETTPTEGDDKLPF